MMHSETFLLLACVLLFPRPCLSQRVTLDVQERSLPEVLRSIEQQTGYTYFISQELLDKAKPVSVRFEDKELLSALPLIFGQQTLTYLIRGHTLLIREKADSSFLAGSVVPNTRPLLRSRISDVYGQPLSRASVYIMDTKQATASDSLGEFLLVHVPDSAQILISYVGYHTRAITANRLKDDIRLYPDQRSLPEVSLTARNGYYPEQRSQATSSADVIPHGLFNRSVNSDVLERIDHLSSGILFNKGDALQTDALLIRGRSSILADARPLVVLDHFPYDGDLHNLNPNDLSDVSILKDAAASSLWGARAANGVIVLSSRKGITPKTSLSFNSSFSLRGRPDLSSVRRISPADFIELEKQLFRENPGQIGHAASANLPLTPVMELLLASQNGLIAAPEAAAQIEALKQNDVRQDIYRYLYQPSFTQRYALDLSGDSPLLNYYLSAGMDQGHGSLTGEQGERNTLRSMLTFKLYRSLQFYGGIRYSQQSKGHGANAGYGRYQLAGKQLFPYARLADDDGNALPVYLQYKPLEEVNLEKHERHLQDVLIQSGVEYRMGKLAGLELHYQYESQPSLLSDRYSASSYYARNLANKAAGGIADTNDGQLFSHQGRAQLNLQKNWHNRHDLRMYLGFEIKHLQNTARSSRDYENQTAGTTDRFLSYFAQAVYRIDSRYYLSASIRKDAANLFGAASNQKVAPFWSLGAGWQHRALKLRASYGVNGNIARNAAAYTVGRLAHSPLSGQDYLYIVSGPNDRLSWERTSLLNLGMDFSAKTQRFSGSLDYYRKSSDQLMGQAPLDPALGLSDIQSNSLYYGNVASMQGEGIDLSLNGRFFWQGPLHWGSTFLLSYNRSIVNDYPIRSGARGEDYLAISPRAVHPVPGKPLFGLYSFPWQGLDGQTGQALGLYQGSVSSDWSTIVHQSTLQDMTFHGSAVPTWFGSLLNSFQYRQWELSCLLSYQLGYYFRKPALSYSNLINSWSGHGEYAQRWQQPGDEARTQVPALVMQPNPDRDEFYQYTSVNVLSGDHIRLEDIRLSYTLDSRQLHIPAIRSLCLFVYAANIAVIWKANKAHIDPYYNDIPANGCSYSLGFNATL